MKTMLSITTIALPLAAATTHLRLANGPHMSAAIDVGAQSWSRCSKATPCADGLSCQWTLDLESQVCKQVVGLVNIVYAGYLELKDIDLNPGKDLKDAGNKSSLFDCVEACQKDSACYGTSQNKNDHWQCYLKHTATNYMNAPGVQSTLYYRKNNFCFGNAELAADTTNVPVLGFDGSFDDCYKCYDNGSEYNAFTWGLSADKSTGHCRCFHTDATNNNLKPSPSTTYAATCAKAYVI
ncbi:hypothetical protein SPRG_09353 [Saprolegnia parasitica CBS 223.65]|uniref:Apple domain-containing protein n=1 Tax=Saprolegnia parasitica (strain CBS 223.65) TaxID=695850 RepID=A0A067CFT1_SAPPC|nr:hypothetical protein SPRG_09353 [Saprolegnia parasitica CBS 223.65]KDO25411.1 hypothetical protein SPRG_09353 [Saprolegnia parasitica CBS 223.65]|eukprot:XP_012203839.1 hypothetical protein SPRG_09353 [Saprolegnia parasitica CBS 223.65]